jgi:hypothetical protein
MSAALSAGAEGNGIGFDAGVGRALALLQEALDIVDSVNAPPEIGARIQEVIDALAQLRKRSGND